jgi:hypothetical protein
VTGLTACQGHDHKRQIIGDFAQELEQLVRIPPIQPLRTQGLQGHHANQPLNEPHATPGRLPWDHRRICQSELQSL